MISRTVVFKSISLTFRGFNTSPQEVEALIGVIASGLGMRGESVKPSVKTLLKRSYAQFKMQFPNGCRLDEMIPALLAYLGGVAHLCEVRDQVQPEFFEIDIVLPIKMSEEQEGGFLSPTTIADLCKLRATLSFQFL